MISAGPASPVLDGLTPRRLVWVRADDQDVEEGGVRHAVPLDGKERGPAICGAQPKREQAWSIFSALSVSCEPCQLLLAGRRP